jgi:hypothetical protein
VKINIAFATKLHARLIEEDLKAWFDQNDIPLEVMSGKTHRS